MPIKVSCQCGKQLLVKDEYAGKRVKCPNCGAILSIPQPQTQAGQSSEGISDLLDDAGMRAGVNRCPGCGAEISEDAVLCVMCGFDLRRGHRLKARVGSAAELDDEDLGELPVHGVPLLDEAERRMAQDRIQQESLSKGVPWWMVLLGFLGVVGFTAGMIAMPQEQVMRNSGIVLIAAGSLLAFFFALRLAIEAFKESVLFGLLFLVLFPLYPLYYIITRWDRVAGVFLFVAAGGVLAGAGVIMLVVLAPLFEGGEGDGNQHGMRAWQTRPIAARVVARPFESNV